MDINKIKRGGYGQDFEISGETRADLKRTSGFSDAVTKTNPPSATKTLKAVDQFSRSELSDPAKLDSMIRACASELIDSGQNLAGRLSVTDKQAVENFLSSDPSFRQQIESYLQKALT